MTDRKTLLILIAIASVAVILIGIVILIYTNKPTDTNSNTVVEKNNLYFVTENPGIGYGICKTDGSVVLEPKFTKMARVNNSVYLRTEENSYIFFLDDGKSITLDGKENEIYFVYDSNNKLLPYFIFRYGETEQTSIYRVFNEKGIRNDTKDFSSLNEAYKYLNAKEVFVPIVAPNNIKDLYNIVSTLDYSTRDGKTQYFVTKKADTSKLQGLVDESGRLILEITYDSLKVIKGAKNVIEADKGAKSYIFLTTEKLVEVDFGFEFATSDGYLLQKRGNTVNKIYSLSGEIVIDGIYNLTDDLTPLNLNTGVAFVLVKEKKGIYSLYNVSTNNKIDSEYSNAVLEYMTSYSGLAKNTSFIYTKDSVYYAVDLESLNSFKMNITANIYSPLDLGVIYKIK